MKIPIVCSTCLKEDDVTILTFLRGSDKLLTVDELVALTGFSEIRVKRSLRIIAQQVAMAHSRKRIARHARIL